MTRAQRPAAAAPRKRVGRPPDTDSEQTRADLLTAAREQFAHRGYDQATNATIAEQVGVTAGTIYHHFGSKLQFYEAIANDCADLVLDQVTAAIDPTSDLITNLKAAIAATGASNARYPYLADFAVSIEGESVRHPELRKINEHFHGRLDEVYRGLAAQAVESGYIADGIELESLMDVIQVLRTAAGRLAMRVGAGTPRYQRAINALSALMDGQLVTEKLRRGR